jgi:hypothetical protein
MVAEPPSQPARLQQHRLRFDSFGHPNGEDDQHHPRGSALSTVGAQAFVPGRICHPAVQTVLYKPAGSRVGASAAVMATTTTNPASTTLKATTERLLRIGSRLSRP